MKSESLFIVLCVPAPGRVKVLGVFDDELCALDCAIEADAPDGPLMKLEDNDDPLAEATNDTLVCSGVTWRGVSVQIHRWDGPEEETKPWPTSIR